MGTPEREFADALQLAATHARSWLDGMPARRVPASADVDAVRVALGTALPEGPTDPAAVIDRLVSAAEPGLVATSSGRFFGFVVGGALPAALAADWLVSTWDQLALLRASSPAAAAVEEVASAWLLEVLGLPAQAAVGFVTGATMANFTGLAAARAAVLHRAGWDAGRDGLAGGPRVRVLVGEERHDTVDLALRYLGMGAPEVVAADEQGRLRAEELQRALEGGGGGPTIVCLQAGNVHSGASDPFEEAVAAAHDAGAWVHVDGAFGLWAAAAPSTRQLTRGIDAADSWATDAHKTLNVPYDSGIAIVRDAGALQAAMSYHGDYLVRQETSLEPYERVPESSRRARGIPVWAALRSLGRSGIAEMIERFCHHAATLANGISEIRAADVLNDVVFTQICVAFETDEQTRTVGRRLMEDGTVWISGSRWHDRDVLRISVSNWSTSDADVEQALRAIRRAAGEARTQDAHQVT